jgi:hypothetical protein
MPMVNVLESLHGVDIRRGYIQLLLRVPNTMFFFGLGLRIDGYRRQEDREGGRENKGQETVGKDRRDRCESKLR